MESDTSPLKKRICNCGCDNLFQPKRKDQQYLNKKHADYAYNNGIRKEKEKEITRINQILKLNNRILEKYYCFKKDEDSLILIDRLVLEGFKYKHFIGLDYINSMRYCLSYNFAYLIVSMNGNIFIDIVKREI